MQKAELWNAFLPVHLGRDLVNHNTARPFFL